MKTAHQEHLEAVAKRNERLYHTSEHLFTRFMAELGWRKHEIEAMISYLKRKEKSDENYKS